MPRKSLASDIDALLGKLDENDVLAFKNDEAQAAAAMGGGRLRGISKQLFLAAIDKSAAELFGRTKVPRFPPTLKQVQTRIGGVEVWNTLQSEEKQRLLKQAHADWLFSRQLEKSGDDNIINKGV